MKRPTTVKELLAQNVEAIHKLDVQALGPMTFTDRLAARVESFAGSPAFIWFHVAWFITWILVNSVVPGRHYDPYPFTFLTFMVSLEAIFLSAFIMMSQNKAAKLSERRSQLDLQINLLAEQEDTKTLRMLASIAAHLGVPDVDDPSVKVLEEATDPELLARQIDRVAAKDRRARDGASEA